MPPLAQRVDQADMGAAAPALLDVWIYMNLVSNTVLLPLLVATFLFSRRARRHPILVNVCMTWIFSGVFSLLLFYAGQAEGPEPVKGLCIAQTSLLYGITPMWSVAVLVLLYHMVLVLNENSKAAGVSRLKMLVMLSAPYVAQFAFSIVTLVASLAQPNKVTRSRRFFYCALQFHPLSTAMSLFTAVVGIGITLLMVYLAVLLYRNWHGMRDAGMPNAIDFQLLLRVLIFGAYIVFGFAVNIISMVAPHNLAPDMYTATIGTVVFFVFGTQPDVLRTWCFWLDNKPRPKTIFLPREANWRYTLDLNKSALPLPEKPPQGKEKTKAERKDGGVARPPAAAARR